MALVLVVAGAGGAAAQQDADTRELLAYRLTMDGVKRFGVAMRTLAAEMKKDPKVQELSKLKTDIEALEAKDELTEAEDARLAAMKEKAEELEQTVEGATNVMDGKTLTEMEARARQSPVVMRALGAAGMTPREYAKLAISLLTSSMYAGMQKSGLLKELPKEASPENVKFVLDHEAELTALQKEWAAWSKESK